MDDYNPWGQLWWWMWLWNYMDFPSFNFGG